MSGGIHYRPNPSELNALEESWSQPKDLTESEGKASVRPLLNDPETSIQINPLDGQTEYTLVIALDDNENPSDGRLFLHDRYTVSNANNLLISRQQAYSDQAEFFPEGPEWLLSQPLALSGQSTTSQDAKWNRLLRRLRSIPGPTLDEFNPSPLWLNRLHRKFPEAFFSTLGKNLHLYQDILDTLQKRRLQMRFLEDQSGYSIIPSEAGDVLRLTIVIDRPEKSGSKEEANGRIFLYEDWTLSTDRKSVVAWERSFETVGNLTSAMEKCLADLNLLSTPSLNSEAIQNALERLVQNLNVPTAELPDHDAIPTAEPASESPTAPHPHEMSPALQGLAKNLLSSLNDSPVEGMPPHLEVFKLILQDTLQGAPIDSHSIAAKTFPKNLTKEGKKLIMIWVHLHQNRIDLAQKEWDKLPAQSAFVQQLGNGIHNLALQEGALEILPILQSTTHTLPATSKEKHESHDLAMQADSEFWKRVEAQILTHPTSLQDALGQIHPQGTAETQTLHHLNNHPLLQELIEIAQEPDQKNRQQLLQSWAKESLIAEHGFFEIAAQVIQGTPPTVGIDSELLAWAKGSPSLGQTLEWSHPKIMEAVFAPRNLMAMTAGVATGAIASRYFLAQVPAGTRGATFAAESLGLFLEAPTFVLTGAFYDSVLAENNHAFQSSSLLKEIGSAYFIFGPLKAARWGARGSATLLARRPWWQAHPKTLALSEGSLAHTLGPLGLFMGNTLSRSPLLEWQPTSPLGWKGNLVLDAVTYAHFLLGGGLAQATLLGVKGSPRLPIPQPIQGAKNSGTTLPPNSGRAYLDFEMDLGRLNHNLIEPRAILEGSQFISVRGKDGEAVLHLENLGSIPLKGDQTLWTLGREHVGAEDLHIGLSRDFKQVSRRQGFFSVTAEGQFTYTDLSRYGVTIDGLSIPPQVPTILKPGSALEFGLDRHLQFIFYPNEGAKPPSSNPPIVPDSFLDAMDPPPRTQRHPALADLNDAQLQVYMQRIHSQTNHRKRVHGHFGSLVVNGQNSYLLNADRTVWFMGRQPEIGIQSDFMEKYMGVIRTPEAGEDVAAIHAVLYVTPEGKVALQNLERGRRLAIQLPKYGKENSGTEDIIAYSQALEVPNWTYLQGRVRIILGENYVVEYSGNLVTPLDRSTLRPETFEPQEADMGIEILENTEEPSESFLGQRGLLPRWDEQTLTLEGFVDLEIRPTQELAGSMLTVDPHGSKPVLLIPVTDPMVQGARIYSTKIGGHQVYLITSKLLSSGSRTAVPQGVPPAVKAPFSTEGFVPIPQRGQKASGFSMVHDMEVRIGDFEFRVNIPE